MQLTSVLAPCFLCLLVTVVGCGSDAADADAGISCREEPALLLEVMYGGPGDRCDFISEVTNIGVDITLGDHHLTRLDATVASRSRFLFAWPDDVADGDNGSVELFATGNGVVASGSSTFLAAPTTCQTVSVGATCCEATDAAGGCP